jgi:hypothetical protein
MTVDLSAFIQIIIGCVVGGIGAYAAVKADIAETKERASTALASAARAHQRIDDLMGKRA